MAWYRDFEHCSNDNWWMITTQADRVLASHWLVIFWIAHPIFGFGLCPYDSRPFNLIYQDITTSVLGFTYITYIYIIISSEWSVITHFWLPINGFLFPTKRIFHSSESNGWNCETQSPPGNESEGTPSSDAVSENVLPSGYLTVRHGIDGP